MWEAAATRSADLTTPHRFPSVARLSHSESTCMEISDSKDGAGTREGQRKKAEDTFLA